MAARWQCGECGSPWAPGAPCCPECRSATHIEDEEAGDVTLKTNRQGVVTDSAAATPDPAARDDFRPDDPDTGDAVGAQAAPEPPQPPATRVPVTPPRRRTPPPRAAGD